MPTVALFSFRQAEIFFLGGAEAPPAPLGRTPVPKLPQFPGMDTFKGDAFHTALWKKDYEPKGKKVAVIGTGASAVQVSMIITMILRDLIVTVNFTSRWQY